MLKACFFRRFLGALLWFTGIWACDLFDNGCPDTGYPPDNRDQVTISQGVWGNVWFWEGNFQPVCPTGTVRPVVREIHIHVGTPHDSVAYEGPSIVHIRTRLVAVVTSNPSGFYQAALDTGAYSLFIKEDSVFYFNISDSRYLAPAYVRPGTVTKKQLDITYNAAY